VTNIGLKKEMELFISAGGIDVWLLLVHGSENWAPIDAFS
jgi:hypothetical protein